MARGDGVPERSGRFSEEADPAQQPEQSFVSCTQVSLMELANEAYDAPASDVSFTTARGELTADLKSRHPFSKASGFMSAAMPLSELPANIGSRVFKEEDPLAAVHRLFVSGDSSGDGQLDQEEFVRIFTQANNMSKEEAEHLFKIFDEDNSGLLSWQEFAASVFSIVNGDKKTKRKYAFLLFDRDLSGCISAAEVKQLFKQSLSVDGLQVSEEELDELVKNALQEAGHDDGNGDITFEEFDRWADKNPEIGMIACVENLFQQWLLDNTVTKQERLNLKSVNLNKYINTGVKEISGAYEWFLNNYKFVIAVTIYTLICIGLFVNTFLTYLNKTNAAVIIARIGGTQLHFNIALCYICSARMALALLEDHVEFMRFVFDFHASIAYHAFLGIAILYWAIIHTAAHLVNYSIMADKNGTSISYYLFSAAGGFGGLIPGWAGPTGFCLIVGFVPMALIAIFRRELVGILPRLFGKRADAFTVFFYSHLWYFAFIVLDLLHAQKSWKWLIVPMVIWIPDRLYQLLMATKEYKIVSLEMLDGGVTRVEIEAPKGDWHHSPGEYAFFLIPSISHIEFHPFTISSSALNTKTFTIHVRSLGDWTKKLHSYYKDKLETDVEGGNSNVYYPKGRDAKIYVKGPFGAPMRGALRKPHVILVAAGIGVTPVASILATLKDFHEAKLTRGDSEQKFSVSSSLRVREQHRGLPTTAGEVMGKAINVAEKALETTAEVLHGVAGKAVESTAEMFHVSEVFDKLKKNFTPSREMRTQRVDVIWVNREKKSFGWFADTLIDLEEKRQRDAEFADFLGIRVFLTGMKGKCTTGGAMLQSAMASRVSKGGTDLITGLRTATQVGRPDWRKILGEYKDQPFGEVQVMFCGPDAMARQLRGHCKEYHMSFKKEYF